MIEKLRDRVAPRRAVSNERGYRRLLRWAALPVTDKRWAGPLAALALGFGIFAGVAIGPGAAGTLATAPYQLLEIPSLADSGGGEEAAEAEEESFAGGEEETGFEEEEATSAPSIVPVAAAPFEPEVETPTEKAAAPQKEKGAEEPEGQELSGTVVHVNQAAGSYTVAEEGGTMSAVHAGKLPALGSGVEVPIRSLVNGTLAEAGKRARAKAAKVAELNGIVTFVGTDPLAPAYTVSNRGTSVLVHVAPDPSGALPQLPVFGTFVTVKAGFEESHLTQSELTGGEGVPYTHIEIEGIVGAFDPEAATLLLSADDLRESGLDTTLTVPPEIDAASLVVGESVLATADLGTDGSLTLTGLAGDERLKGAEDTKAIQGDLVPEKERGQE